MSDIIKNVQIIGRAEKVDFPDIESKRVPAKIDTGADACSIWANSVALKKDQLHCVFFGPGSDYYTGKTYVFPKSSFTITRIANSFGQREVRYKIKLRIKLKERIIRGTFTLSDRSSKIYPVLIGRSLLRGKFIVDVSKGSPMKELEKAKALELRKALSDLREELGL